MATGLVKKALPFLWLLQLLMVGASIDLRDVSFSGGELLDIIVQLETMGLEYWPKDDSTVPLFYVFNDNLKRYFQLSTGMVGNHVTVIGSVRVKPAGNLFELRRLDEGFITFAIDNDTGVGNGASASAILQTGQWLDDPSHQYALHRSDSANVVMLQNRGNGLCVSADGKTENPLIIAACDPSDLKQQWQFCQNQINRQNADKLCWPRDDTPGAGAQRSVVRSASSIGASAWSWPWRW